MSTEQSPLIDEQSVVNFNEMEYQKRIVTLLQAVSAIKKSANDGVSNRPENTSEQAWMGAKLGEIHALCAKAIEEVSNG